MTASPPTTSLRLDAAALAEQAALVGEMKRWIRRLLDQAVSRSEVQLWCLDQRPSGAKSPFRDNGTASSIFESLCNLEEEAGAPAVIRPSDLRSYLAWLDEGQAFRRAKSPLVTLDLSSEELSGRIMDGREVRYWLDGMGWVVERRVGSKATARPFVVETSLHAHAALVFTQTDDVTVEALMDLYETLAIDARDTLHLADGLDLTALPLWSLHRQDDNGNVETVERFGSVTKAQRACEAMESRGHRQTYWVEKDSSLP